MFLDHTQRRTTVGTTPLDAWSARRRDLWQHTTLTTEKYPCPRWESKPRSQQTSDRRPLACYLGFDSHRGHGYLSVVRVVCCQRSLRRADHSSRGVLPTVLRVCVWSRNIKNGCSIYIYIYIYIDDIRSLRINDLTLILLTWRKWWAPNNASKQLMGFNSSFKGLRILCQVLRG